jgi:AraC-like DNA-binding protein
VSRIKIKESSLKIHEQVADDYYKILIDYINKEKPYLNENCTIQYVSKNTNISIHHLSNILNNKVNKNFSDFINEFRINEAKQMLCSKIFEKKTVEAIGYDCGFGSKTSFNKVFKKYTNLTPSNYRNQAKL